MENPDRWITLEATENVVKELLFLKKCRDPKPILWKLQGIDNAKCYLKCFRDQQEKRSFEIPLAVTMLLMAKPKSTEQSHLWIQRQIS